MYDMTFDIRIGSYRLRMVDSVTVKTSVEELTDTAVITLPASVYNVALNVEDKIRRGDKVSIAFGYDGNNRTEFEGYLNSIKTDGGKLTLECEDAIYLYKVSIADEEIKNISVKELLERMNAAVANAHGVKIDLRCDYDFSYDKFVISNATAFDVLKKVQEEAKSNIYLKGKTLHVHPQYSEVLGSVVYDFAKNVESEDLKYVRAEDRRLMVVIKGKGADGKTFQIEVGTTGGDKITLDRSGSGISDKASLKKMAEEELKRKNFTGYEGSLTGWLLPVCDAGYKVKIRDGEYEYKNGTYYVLAVETEFSQSGGKRKVKFGKKLENG